MSEKSPCVLHPGEIFCVCRGSVGASLPGAAPKSRIAAFRAEWEVFRHAPFGAPVGFVERLLAALEANAPDPFVLVGMEGRDDDEAHAAMLAADCAAWLAENPREYPFSTTKLAEKLVRLGWRAMWRGAALEAGAEHRAANEESFKQSGLDWCAHQMAYNWPRNEFGSLLTEGEYAALLEDLAHAANENTLQRGVRGESLPSDAKIAPCNPGNAVGRVGGEE